MMMHDRRFPPGFHTLRTDDHLNQPERIGGGAKVDGEEEIKEGTRDVAIQVWGFGLLVALRIKQQA